MRSFAGDWNAFWFRPQTGRVLGLYRIALGLLTIYSFSLFAKDVTVFFSDEGVLRAATLPESMARPYHTVLQWITQPTGVKLTLGALFLSAFCFTIGWYTRISSIVLYALLVSFHERNNLVLNGGDTVLRTMLFFFLFAPAGAAFSVDSFRRRLRAPQEGPVLIEPWPQRMMQIQAAIIYLVTAYAKSRGSMYHDGTAMYYVFGLVDFNVRGVEQLMNFPLAYSFLTYAVLFVELSLPFLLWFQATRRYAVMLGLLAHGWIIFFMTIPVFGVLMLATYIPFFSEEELDLALERLRLRFEGRRAKLYFDAACLECEEVARIVGMLDLLGCAEPVEAQGVSDADLPTGLSRQALLGGRVLVTPRGTVLKGFDAYRWLALRMPATFWAWPLLFLPGVSSLGRGMCRRNTCGRSQSPEPVFALAAFPSEGADPDGG